MNSAIAVLTHEHKMIMKVVKALGIMSNELVHGSPIAIEQLRQIVQFMREFADKCHHAKEEDILFPELAKHGVPETGCPLAALRLEHLHARELVTQLSKRTDAYHRREPGAANALMAVIGDIGTLYSSHIWKEENMVFPLVDRLFPPADIERLAQRFEQAEKELGQDHDALERFAQNLAGQAP
jgi:hemerythrin-like domain-containing protein